MEEHMKGNAYVRAFQEFFLRFKVYVPEQTPSYSFSFPGKSHRVKLWTTRYMIYFDPSGIACNPQVCHLRWSFSIVGMWTVKRFSIQKEFDWVSFNDSQQQ